jgi:hypothetical protein
MPEKTRYDFDSLSTAWQMAVGRASTFWCDLMHDSPMWPIHGHYECRTCGRHYLVPWAADGIPPAPVKLAGGEPARSLQRGVASLGSALLPRIILFALLLAPQVYSAEASDLTTYTVSDVRGCIETSLAGVRSDRNRDREGAECLEYATVFLRLRTKFDISDLPSQISELPLPHRPRLRSEPRRASLQSNERQTFLASWRQIATVPGHS